MESKNNKVAERRERGTNYDTDSKVTVFVNSKKNTRGPRGILIIIW